MTDVIEAIVNVLDAEAFVGEFPHYGKDRQIRMRISRDKARDKARAILAKFKDEGLKVVARIPTAMASRRELHFNDLWDAAPWVPGEKQ